MKVTIVDPSNFTPYYDVGLCRALSRAGCNLTLATSHFAYETLPFACDEGIEYRFFRFSNRLRNTRLRRVGKALEYPFDLARFALHLARSGTDVLHFQWLVAPQLELPILRLVRRGGCKLVYTIHNLLPHETDRTDDRLHRMIADAVDALIVHSESAGRELCGVLGHLGSRVHVIPHGILFGDLPKIDQIEARRRLGLPEHGKLVLFFGLIERYKGVHFLAEALPAIRARHPDTKLLIAGSRGSGIGALTAQLQIPEIAGHTIFRPGFVASEDVNAYFCASDVVALPYLSASQSGVLMSAYRFARPVVVTGTGPLGETVSDDQTGLVVPPGDTAALAEAISALLATPALAKEMAERQRNLSATRYSWATIARQTITLYQMR